MCVTLLLNQVLRKPVPALPLKEWQAEVTKLRKLFRSSLSLHAVPLGSSMVELYLTQVRSPLTLALTPRRGLLVNLQAATMSG